MMDCFDDVVANEIVLDEDTCNESDENIGMNSGGEIDVIEKQVETDYDAPTTTTATEEEDQEEMSESQFPSRRSSMDEVVMAKHLILQSSSRCSSSLSMDSVAKLQQSTPSMLLALASPSQSPSLSLTKARSPQHTQSPYDQYHLNPTRPTARHLPAVLQPSLALETMLQDPRGHRRSLPCASPSSTSLAHIFQGIDMRSPSPSSVRNSTPNSPSSQNNTNANATLSSPFGYPSPSPTLSFRPASTGHYRSNHRRNLSWTIGDDEEVFRSRHDAASVASSSTRSTPSPANVTNSHQIRTPSPGFISTDKHVKEHTQSSSQKHQTECGPMKRRPQPPVTPKPRNRSASHFLQRRRVFCVDVGEACNNTIIFSDKKSKERSIEDKCAEFRANLHDFPDDKEIMKITHKRVYSVETPPNKVLKLIKRTTAHADGRKPGEAKRLVFEPATLAQRRGNPAAFVSNSTHPDTVVDSHFPQYQSPTMSRFSPNVCTSVGPVFFPQKTRPSVVVSHVHNNGANYLFANQEIDL
eukprot:m.35036 g.35036  ORF g.35036 m.35036 type:complete len:525 (-) comp6579_c0_seq2:72-1646(-)